MEGCPMESVQQDMWFRAARESDSVHRPDVPEHDSGGRLPVPGQEETASSQKVQPATLSIPLGGKRLVSVFSHLRARSSNSASLLP